MGFITPPEGFQPGEDPRPLICANCGTPGFRSSRFCAQCGIAFIGGPREAPQQLFPPVQFPPAQYPQTLQHPQPPPPLAPPYPQQSYSRPVYPAPPQYVIQAPNVSQHVTVVQADAEPAISGCAIAAIVLLVPLWPITIPILIIVLLVNGSRRRRNESTYQPDWTVLLTMAAIVAVIVAALYWVRSNRISDGLSSPNTVVNRTSPVAIESERARAQRVFKEDFLKACNASSQESTGYRLPVAMTNRYCSCTFQYLQQTGSEQDAKEYCTREVFGVGNAPPASSDPH